MNVFISSTYRDLKKERQDLLQSLKKADIECSGMEFFGAQPGAPKEVCFGQIRSADLVILIIGDSYGSVDPETSKSFTQLEFEEAQAQKKPVLGFLFKSKGPIDPKLDAFRVLVEHSGIVVDYFSDYALLSSCVLSALFRHFRERGEITRDVPTFQTFSDYFDSLLDTSKLFNHCHRLVGRDKELNDLRAFIKDSNRRICILHDGTGRAYA